MNLEWYWKEVAAQRQAEIDRLTAKVQRLQEALAAACVARYMYVPEKGNPQ